MSRDITKYVSLILRKEKRRETSQKRKSWLYFRGYRTTRSVKTILVYIEKSYLFVYYRNYENIIRDIENDKHD